MKTCLFCGARLADTDVFCASCGHAQTVAYIPPAPPVPAAPYPSYTPPASRTLPKASSCLAWSIVLLFFFPLCGIPGLVFSILAKSAHTDDKQAHDYLLGATITCASGTVLGGIFCISFLLPILLTAIVLLLTVH